MDSTQVIDAGNVKNQVSASIMAGTFLFTLSCYRLLNVVRIHVLGAVLRADL